MGTTGTPGADGDTVTVEYMVTGVHCASEDADVAGRGELPRDDTTGAEVAGDVGTSDVPGTTGVVGTTTGVVAGTLGTTTGVVSTIGVVAGTLGTTTGVVSTIGVVAGTLGTTTGVVGTIGTKVVETTVELAGQLVTVEWQLVMVTWLSAVLGHLFWGLLGGRGNLRDRGGRRNLGGRGGLWLIAIGRCTGRNLNLAVGDLRGTLVSSCQCWDSGNGTGHEGSNSD